MAARYSVGEAYRLASPISSASCLLVMGRSSPVMSEKSAPTRPSATKCQRTGVSRCLAACRPTPTVTASPVSRCRSSSHT